MQSPVLGDQRSITTPRLGHLTETNILLPQLHLIIWFSSSPLWGRATLCLWDNHTSLSCSVYVVLLQQLGLLGHYGFLAFITASSLGLFKRESSPHVSVTLYLQLQVVGGKLARPRSYWKA